MTLRLDPRSIVFDEFGGLEPAEPQWLAERAYWEDYNHRFFRSNGLDYRPEDSNVDRWLTACDRAPYAFMARALLPRLSARMGDLSDIDMVLFAHWLPDLHLGTSVTNFALHHLGLTEGFGFALSDRGRSAPLFALNCLDRCLTGARRRAILMVMDQKHLLYRSALVDRLDPVNSAAVMVLDRTPGAGLAVSGYHRIPQQPAASLPATLRGLLADWGCAAAQTTLIADPALLALADHRGRGLAQDPRHLCAAPFAALARCADLTGPVVLLCQEGAELTALCLKPQPAAVTGTGPDTGLMAERVPA